MVLMFETDDRLVPPPWLLRDALIGLGVNRPGDLVKITGL